VLHVIGLKTSGLTDFQFFEEAGDIKQMIIIKRKTQNPRRPLRRVLALIFNYAEVLS
jgi:hypothetical protein